MNKADEERALKVGMTPSSLAALSATVNSLSGSASAANLEYKSADKGEEQVDEAKEEVVEESIEVEGVSGETELKSDAEGVEHVPAETGDDVVEEVTEEVIEEEITFEVDALDLLKEFGDNLVKEHFDALGAEIISPLVKEINRLTEEVDALKEAMSPKSVLKGLVMHSKNLPIRAKENISAVSGQEDEPDTDTEVIEEAEVETSTKSFLSYL